MTNHLPQKNTQNQPQTAWLFDIDGVLTDPEIKRVTLPGIFNELVSRLKKGEPIGLNTGRSLDFIITQILNPLELVIMDKNLLCNIIAVGEKGAAWIMYDASGEKTIHQDPSVCVPRELQIAIRELVSKPPYSETMFYDETKRTMISIELKEGKTIAEFKNSQQALKKALQVILSDKHLENDMRIDPTRIATDVESKYVGKALGARKFIELLNEKGVSPERYIGFGDSVSDYEMFEELIRLGKKSQFVFVGGREHLIGKKDLALVEFTKELVDKGTLQYLKSH